VPGAFSLAAVALTNLRLLTVTHRTTDHMHFSTTGR